MALRKPLVIVSGVVEQIQSGDTLDATLNENESITQTNDNASAITIGMPVYSKVADHVDKAEANASGTVQVLGLVSSATIAAAGTGSIQTSGNLTCADWTAVIGSASLTSGSVYYLDPATAGKLTATAPSTVGQYVVRVGQAYSTTEMCIRIQPPILL